MCVCVCVCACVCACARARARARARACVCVCVCVWMFVCVWSKHSYKFYAQDHPLLKWLSAFPPIEGNSCSHGKHTVWSWNGQSLLMITVIIRMTLIGTIWDFFGLLTALQTFYNMYSQVARMQLWQIMCNTTYAYPVEHVIYHMVWRTAQHLFQLYFVGWNHLLMKELSVPITAGYCSRTCWQPCEVAKMTRRRRNLSKRRRRKRWRRILKTQQLQVSEIVL